MAHIGTVWSGMLGLQRARFDLLEVWDPRVNTYVNVATMLEYLETQIDDLSIADTSRLDAIEAKHQSLDEQRSLWLLTL